MLLVLLAAGAAQAVEPGPAPASTCRPALARTVTAAPVQSRKLGELPPGLLQLAVDRRVDGCSVTVLPIRDAAGNHLMVMPDRQPRVVQTDQRRSGPQGRTQRHR